MSRNDMMERAKSYSEAMRKAMEQARTNDKDRSVNYISVMSNLLGFGSDLCCAQVEVDGYIEGKYLDFIVRGCVEYVVEKFYSRKRKEIFDYLLGINAYRELRDMVGFLATTCRSVFTLTFQSADEVECYPCSCLLRCSYSKLQRINRLIEAFNDFGGNEKQVKGNRLFDRLKDALESIILEKAEEPCVLGAILQLVNELRPIFDSAFSFYTMHSGEEIYFKSYADGKFSMTGSVVYESCRSIEVATPDFIDYRDAGVTLGLNMFYDVLDYYTQERVKKLGQLYVDMDERLGSTRMLMSNLYDTSPTMGFAGIKLLF